MAGKKGSEKKGPTISGAVRMGGKTYVPGQEEELQKAMEDAEVEEVRGFGVDSTDVSSRGAMRGQRRADIELRRAQAREEANPSRGSTRRNADGTKLGGGSEGGEGGDEGEPVDFGSLTLAELPGALEQSTDRKAIQKAARKDERAGAEPLYAARLEALKSAPSGGAAGGGTDAPRTGQTGLAG